MAKASRILDAMFGKGGKKKEKPHLEKEMVRIFVSDMIKMCDSLRKRFTTEVAKKMAEYIQNIFKLTLKVIS